MLNFILENVQEYSCQKVIYICLLQKYLFDERDRKHTPTQKKKTKNKNKNNTHLA